MASLVIDIVTETSKAVSGLNQVGDAATKQQSKFKQMGSTIAAAVSVTAIVAFGKAAVTAATDDAAAQALLASALKNTVNATDAQIAAGEEFITNLSKQAAVTDDELRPALATLTRAFGDQGQAQRNLALATNIAAGTGKPLATVVKAMASAAQGSTGAFAKLTNQTTKLGGETQTMDELMYKAAQTFHGQAAVAADTTAGKMKGAQIAMGEMSETLGAALLPALSVLADFLTENIQWLGPLALGIAAIVVALKAWSIIQGVLNVVLLANPIGLVVAAVVALIAIVVLLWKNWDKVVAFLKKAWESIRRVATTVFTAIGDVIEKVFNAVKNVIFGIWEAIKSFFVGYFNWLKDIFVTAFNWVKDKVTTIFNALPAPIKNVFNGIRDYFEFVWNAIKTIFQGAWDFFQKFVDFLGTIGDTIADTWNTVTSVISGVWESVVSGLTSAVNWIIDRINSVIGAINTAIGVVNKLPGVNIGSIPSIPRLAEGGIVTKATLAVIGERGPEAVIPLNRAGGMGGSTYTLNMYPRKADAQDVAWGFRRLELARTGR